MQFFGGSVYSVVKGGSNFKVSKGNNTKPVYLPMIYVLRSYYTVFCYMMETKTAFKYLIGSLRLA